MLSPLETTTGSTNQDGGEVLLEAIHQCAVSTKDPADAAWLEAQWAKDEEQCRRFVELVLMRRPAVPRRRDGAPATPDPAAREQELLETCARAVIRSIQTRILREDLSALADAIRGEGDDCADTSQAWLADYDASLTAGTGTLGPERLWALWELAEQVGKEELRGEVGSDTFARTAAHAATVAASTVGAPTRPKAVVTALSALRGYTLAVWAMVTLLTRKSHFGPRVVQLAVAAGGVLLAAAIFVPAMPLGFTLAGVLLLLAGLSAGALLTEEARGVGWRLGIWALVAAAALGGYVYWDWTRNGFSGTLASLLTKVGIGVLVVFVGWFIARAHPRGIRRDRAVGRRAGRSAGADAGEEAGRRAGADAGADAGRTAGRLAGEQPGRLAGEKAGARSRRANRLLQYLPVRNPEEREVKVRMTVQRASQEAGARAGRRAGAQAGREAGA
jgi:hypothetical protein